jgi:tRNA nucleotidyltransferase (CCA-adding enzyme)
VREIREEDACLSLKKLQICGDDLIRMGVPAGKRIGTILQFLLDEVIEERLPNEKQVLLQAAKEQIKKD